MSEERISLIGTAMFTGPSSHAARVAGQRLPGIKTLTLIVVLMAAPVVLADRPDGFDVSHWQGEITPAEWQQAYNAGKVFCFTKATQSNWFTDSEFVDNMIEGSQAGILMGCYHFADPEYTGAIAEADHFVSVAGPYLTNGYLRPVLDLEWGSGLGSTGLSNWVNIWLDRVQSLTGVEPLIYTNTNYATNYLNSTVAHRDLWIANWSTSYDPETDDPPIGVFNSWAFWQWTDSCPIPGIGDTVDCDVFNGTMAELQNFVIGGGNQAPTFTQHPSDQAVLEGGTATFTALATGTEPLVYRWQKNDVDLSNGGHYSGVTTTTLTVSMVDSSDEADYRCRAINGFGNATSNTATLTVLLPLGDECLQNAGFEDGFTGDTGNSWLGFYDTGTVGFFASIDSRSGSYAQGVDLGNGSTMRGGVYQQFNAVDGQQYVISAHIKCDSTQVDGGIGADPSGGTDPNAAGVLWDYTQSQSWLQQSVTVTASGNTITVFLNARGKNGNVLFDDISPDCSAIPDPPVITQHPSDRTVAQGGMAQFTVAATGGGTLTYQWQKDGSNLSDGGHFSGVTTTTLTISDVDGGDAGIYHCVVSNEGGDTPSDGATFTVTAQPGDFDNDGDVDLADYGFLQLCYGGPDVVPPDPACQAAWLDNDFDVDIDDFGVFQACISGPDVPANPSCAD
jgi:lysozyme